jgi:hypothetical protein
MLEIKTVTNGPIAIQVQRVCHDTLPRGFTRGAIDFARDKPILFLDTDDLIAMQEGRDVLAEAFTPSQPVTKS